MITRINSLNGLLIKDIRWEITTAGPSPLNNKRTELFLLGCNKAMMGNPCKGCFNGTTWDKSKAEFSHDPILVAKHINKVAPNKYITISGGEPLDQIEQLTILCRELKLYGFHIMIYTWRQLNNINCNAFKNEIFELLNYVDIVIDGEYKESERLWDGSKEDGFISSIGSGNQIVWDIKNKVGFAMRDINKIILEDNTLFYSLKNKCKKNVLV